MTLDEQREFIRMFVAKVSVKRARPGTKDFDSDRDERTQSGRRTAGRFRGSAL
jgi:hypothetical protein